MTRVPIVLAGAGGHARACIDVIEQQGGYEVVGLVGLPSEVGTNVLGYRVLGSDRDLAALLRDVTAGLVAVGQIRSPEVRMRLFDAMCASGCQMPAILSPKAYVSPHASVGAGTIVMHGAVVNANATVGRNCIINSQSLIEHDSIVGDHCHVATGAVLNSGVVVGSGTFIGSMSAVRELVSVGERCVIGMAQRVLNDCERGTQLPRREGP